MRLRPPRSTRTDTLFPSRRSSDLRAVIAVAALRDICGCNDGVSSTSRIGIVANALRNGCGISITDLINECRRKLHRLSHIAVVIIAALGNAQFSIHIAVARGVSETRPIGRETV